jgi:hypothetical protein
MYSQLCSVCWLELYTQFPQWYLLVSLHKSSPERAPGPFTLSDQLRFERFIWLVVEPSPLKNMSQLGWWPSQLFLESHKSHVPNLENQHEVTQVTQRYHRATFDDYRGYGKAMDYVLRMEQRFSEWLMGNSWVQCQSPLWTWLPRPITMGNTWISATENQNPQKS